MPDRNNSTNQNVDEKQEEDFQKIFETAIPLAGFRQYVENNIPYEGYVFGVGKIKYYDTEDAEDPLVMIPDTQSGDTPIPYRRNETEKSSIYDDPWFWGGLISGGFSLCTSAIEFDMNNPWYWKSAKGKRFSKTKYLRRNPVTNRYIKGMPVYRKSFLRAVTKAQPLSKMAAKVGYVGLIIPVAHSIYEQKISVEDTTDFVFAAVAFIPAVGWIISGLYFAVDLISQITTEEKIASHAARGVAKFDDYLFTKWVEFNQGIKNWINSMSFGYYPIP